MGWDGMHNVARADNCDLGTNDMIALQKKRGRRMIGWGRGIGRVSRDAHFSFHSSLPSTSSVALVRLLVAQSVKDHLSNLGRNGDGISITGLTFPSSPTGQGGADRDP